MKRLINFSVIIAAILLGLASCSDDVPEFQANASFHRQTPSSKFTYPNSPNYQAKSTRATTDNVDFDTNWEKVESLVLPNGNTMTLPWSDKYTGVHPMEYTKDIKREDGWLLLCHTFNQPANQVDPLWLMAFYNQMTGDLKIFYYVDSVLSHNNAFWTVNFTQNNGWLNAINEIALPTHNKFGEAFNWTASVHPNEKTTSLSQGWNSFVIPTLSYDPDAPLNAAIRINNYQTTAAIFDIYGKEEGEINGQLITMGTTNQFSGLQSTVASAAGNAAQNLVKAWLSSNSKINANQSEIAAAGIGQLVKWGVGKIVGKLTGKFSKPTYSEQNLKLEMKSRSTFKGSMITSGITGVPGTGFGVGKATTGVELGVWNLTENPTIYIHPVGVMCKTFNGVNSDEAEYRYVASGNFKADIVINPQLLPHVISYKVTCEPVRYWPKTNGDVASLPQSLAPSSDYGSLGSKETGSSLKYEVPDASIIYEDNYYTIYDNDLLGYATYWGIWNRYGKHSGLVPLYRYIYGPSNQDLCRGGGIAYDCKYNYAKVTVEMETEFEGKRDTVVTTRTYVPKFEWDPKYVESYGTNSMSSLQGHAYNDPILSRIDNGCYSELERKATPYNASVKKGK